ncbi:MAG: hypothetical protein FD146_68 [Anaerolineaceae bacterium]|nr:MAG: hypothetical protein FD146_68 [Anaerolineaceae bacterium]
MKTNRQKSNWILDVLLFTGFFVSFILQLTGLSLHQWIGVFGGLLAVYHLVLHWDWVTAVTMRFFGKTSGQARTYYLLDVSIMLGFYLILVTGLVISTWLDLPLTNYVSVKDFHVTISLVTLGLVALKIGLHGRWIVRVARQFGFRPAAAAPEVKLLPLTKPVPAVVSNAMSRRDFLKLMGIVGAASLAAFAFTLDDSQNAQASAAAADTAVPTEALPTQDAAPTAVSQNATATGNAAVTVPASTPVPTATATVEATPTVPYTAPTVSACIVRCDKRCSYPGQCRHYQDFNGNNLCDLGECM